MQILLDEDDKEDEGSEEEDPKPYGLYVVGLYDDETLIPMFFAFFVAVSKIRCIIL